MNRTQRILKFCAAFIVSLGVLMLLAWANLWIGLGMGIVFTTVCAILYWRAQNKLVSCVLAASIVASPNVFGEDSYAGYSGQHCYCFEPAVEQPLVGQHAITLDFILEPNDLGDIQPRILSMDKTAPQNLVDYDGLNASLIPWGLDLNKGEQYAKNGQPASAADMPFVFGDLTAPLVVHPELEQYRVVVEQATEFSSEFIYWQPVAYFSVPAGIRINFHDSPEGDQTFYRVRLERVVEDFQAAGPVLLGCGLGFLVGTAVIAVLVVRQCAKNKKKFQAMLPPKKTNDVDQAQNQ